VISINRGRSQGVEVGTCSRCTGPAARLRAQARRAVGPPLSCPTIATASRLCSASFDRVSYALVMNISKPVNTRLVQNP
jgi:hypothetical protein